MDNSFAYAFNLAAGICLVFIFYKIIKGIINLFKGITRDVKYTAEKVKDNRERKANLPLLADDIVRSIKSQCQDISQIERIVLSHYSGLNIYLTDKRNLEYSFEKHGYSVSLTSYSDLADLLAQRLFLTKQPILNDTAYDAYGRTSYTLEGYSLISDRILEKQRRERERKESLKRC